MGTSEKGHQDNPSDLINIAQKDSSFDISNVDSEAEAKLIRKLDLMIIPPVMLLYLFSFLDRVNIGNAYLYHLERDLNLSPTQFQTAVSILFVTYLLSELPSNLVLKKFRPSRWISFIALSWGIVATLTGVVQSYAGLIVCRLILGALEGGLFPGLTVYLTLYYTKREIALRVGYLFVSAAIAGSVGGLLAYGIGHMDGVAGQSGWRWILIIEGLPSIVLGAACWFWLADEPKTAYYLSISEKELIRSRKMREVGYSQSGDQFHREDVVKGLKDWKIWAFCFAQFGADTMLYGYSTFLPTIIRGLNSSWSLAQIQAFTVPCYALGAITYLTVAWVSDRTQQRGVYAALFGLVSIAGYGILIADVSSGVQYFGCFLVAMGLYVNVGLPLGWLPSTHDTRTISDICVHAFRYKFRDADCIVLDNPRYGKRTTATGLQLTVGNSSGIMAPFLYRSREGPRYIRGHAVTLAMVAFASLIYSFMSVYFRLRNEQRSRGIEDHLLENKTDEQIAEMGDENPRYRFTY